MTILSSQIKSSLPQSNAVCFFMVLARDAKDVPQKIAEVQRIGVPFIIVCGEPFNDLSVVYRKAMGKWDAINFSARFIPPGTDMILFNDVDTRIHNINLALQAVTSKADLVYCRVNVSQGPQVLFYRILNPIRQRFHICAS